MKGKVFISHSSDDNGSVHRLAERLRAHKLTVVYDRTLAGENLEDWITDQIRSSDVVLVCWSRNVISRPGWVAFEASQAKACNNYLAVAFDESAPLEQFRATVPIRLSDMTNSDPGLASTLAAIRRKLSVSEPKFDSIQLGRLHIDGIVSVAQCSHRIPVGARDGDIRIEFARWSDRPRTPVPYVDELGALLNIEYERASTAGGRPFTDGRIVDIVAATALERVRGTESATRTISLSAAPGSYRTWIGSSGSLGVDLSAQGVSSPYATIGEFLGYPRPTTIAELAQVGLPARVGVVVSAVTSDGYLAFHTRRRNLEAPDGFHFVGEGMIPTDVIGDRLSPDATAFRGLSEEVDIHSSNVDLSLTGIFIDQTRLQLVFTYVAELEIDADEYALNGDLAVDSFESTGFEFYELRSTNKGLIERLLAKEAPDSGASNHARVALLQALAFADGPSAVLNAVR